MATNGEGRETLWDGFATRSQSQVENLSHGEPGLQPVADGKLTFTQKAAAEGALLS